MIKSFTELQTTEVKVDKLVCDLCGEIVPEDTTSIKLYTTKVNIQRRYQTFESLSPVVDICSVNCLTNKVKGLSLLITTKLIPQTESAPPILSFQG